jgi:hypothetical protein
MKEPSKRSFARRAAKVWTVAGVTNLSNDSSVTALQASSVQVATLRWDQSANSTNAMIAFCEARSTLTLGE